MSKAPMTHVSTDVLREFIAASDKKSDKCDLKDDSQIKSNGVNGLDESLEFGKMNGDASDDGKSNSDKNDDARSIAKPNEMNGLSSCKIDDKEVSNDDDNLLNSIVKDVNDLNNDLCKNDSKSGTHELSQKTHNPDDSLLLGQVDTSSLLEETVLTDDRSTKENNENIVSKKKENASDSKTGSDSCTRASTNENASKPNFGSPRSDSSFHLLLSDSYEEVDDIDAVSEEKLLKGIDELIDGINDKSNSNKAADSDLKKTEPDLNEKSDQPNSDSKNTPKLSDSEKPTLLDNEIQSTKPSLSKDDAVNSTKTIETLNKPDADKSQNTSKEKDVPEKIITFLDKDLQNSAKNIENESLPPILNFSDAFASLAMERPTSIIPVDNSLQPENTTNLTLLSPKSNENILNSSEGKSQTKGTKRSLSTDDKPLDGKPDLKKFRLIKDKPDANGTAALNGSIEMALASVTKKLEEVGQLESRLMEEKALEKTSSEGANIPDDDLVVLVDKEDLDQKIEQERSKLSHNKLKKIRRKDLENLVIELFVDKVLYEHQLGQQKDLCNRLESTIESNRKKAAQFHKELEDLKKVTHKLQEEFKARKNVLVAPVKIRRSVGIQASPGMINKGLIPVNNPPTASSKNSMLPNRSQAKQVRQPIDISQPESLNPRNPNSERLTTISTQSSSFTSSVPKASNTLSSSQRKQTVSSTGTQSAVSSAPAVSSYPLVIQSQPQVSQATNVSTSSSILQATLQHGPPPSKKTSSNVIDLTDDDEVTRIPPVSTSNLLTVQRSTTSTNGSVAGNQVLAINPNQSSVSQILILPTTPAAAKSSPALLVQGRTPVTAAPARPNLVQPFRGAQRNRHIAPAALNQHPAPLPKAPPQQTIGYSKKLPPSPILKLSHKDNSIVLSWNMMRTDEHEKIASYQLYAYQEGSSVPSSALWKKVGSVKALELPMACTLTQFMPGHIYHFAVRAIDIRTRLGPFSQPKSIRLGRQ